MTNRELLEREVLSTIRSVAAERGYKPLNSLDLMKLHEATMEVFAEVGFEVHNERAFELFKDIAYEYDSDNRIIKLKESRIQEILSTVPPQITLYGREDRHNAALGGDNVYFGTGGTALNIYDYENQTSTRAELSDLIDIARIVDRLDNIHILLLPTYPNELPVERVDENRFFTGLMYTSKHVMGGVYTSEGIRNVIRMAEKVMGSPEALRERPIISIITCGISPLKLDDKYGHYLMQVAEQGIPVAVPVEPLCGTTSPVTLAGNLLIQNCDSLINVMLSQLVNPGAPVIYGCVATSADFRDMKYLGAPVESGLLNAASAQLARFYEIPYYGTAGISDSKTLDAQCGYESAINNLLVALAGGDFIHDAAGLMEFAMTVSKEKLVIDNEILGMALRAANGIEVNEETLAVDVIRKVGPGGHFVASRHTRRHMHGEHYQPELSDRDHREEWEDSGELTTAEKAHDKVREILNDPVESYLSDSDIEEIMEDFSAIDAESYSRV